MSSPTTGRVLYAQAHADFRVRPEPEEALAAGAGSAVRRKISRVIVYAPNKPVPDPAANPAQRKHPEIASSLWHLHQIS